MPQSLFKKAVLSGTAVLTVVATVTAGNARAEGLAREAGVTAQEIHLRYYPDKGYIHLKEYNLSGNAQFADLQALVNAAAYCDTHFNFAHIESVEERIFMDRSHVKAECHLLAHFDDVAQITQDLLSGVLDRPVGAGIKEGELRASFDLPGMDIALADNNAEGLFPRGERGTIVWKTPQPFYESVWTVTRWPDSATSLNAVLEQDLQSPEISEEQLQTIRARLRSK